jgi:hypothetical protein
MEYNGQGQDIAEIEELAARDLERIANRDTKSIAVLEAVHPELPPFDQQAHELMLKSIDRVANAWVTELQAVRNNTQVVEQMVLTACTKAKADITRLHLLGGAVMQEAKRGEEVCSQLEEQIDRLMSNQP